MFFSDCIGFWFDVIINLYVFLLWMIIGMFVESLVVKVGVSIGIFADVIFFKYSDKEILFIEEYGKLFWESGYNFCGSECLVNGCIGESFSVDIFIGFVYY